MPDLVQISLVLCLLIYLILRASSVSKLVLHAKQLYLMPQHTNPSSYTSYFTFVTTPQSPTQTVGLGWGGLRGWVKLCCNDIIAD